jgi:hypothetical protein
VKVLPSEYSTGVCCCCCCLTWIIVRRKPPHLRKYVSRTLAFNFYRRPQLTRNRM